MSATRKVLIFLTIGIVAVVTVLFMKLSENTSESPPVQVARIVVAKRDLAVGSFIQGTQDLDWAPVPESSTLAAPTPDGAPTDPAAPANAPRESFLYENSVKLTDFNGAVVRRALRTGDPVPQNALMKSGEGGFMSAVLEAGMRAVSIAVNATSGNAGFVSPGDRVDLIVTHRIKQQAGGGGNEESVVSETFIRNIRVVAVDQMIDNPENKAILAKTVTVEVAPRQAEEVAVAAEMGKISLALRSLTNPEPKPDPAKEEAAEGTKEVVIQRPNVLTELYGAEPPRLPQSPAPFTRDSDLSMLLGRKSVLVPRVQVIRGDKSENLDFYQDKK